MPKAPTKPVVVREARWRDDRRRLHSRTCDSKMLINRHVSREQMTCNWMMEEDEYRVAWPALVREAGSWCHPPTHGRHT